MYDDRAFLIFGIIVALPFIVGAVYLSHRHQDLINECEKHLSRDSHCHLTAVPDNK
jgi:hypothetical protein